MEKGVSHSTRVSGEDEKKTLGEQSKPKSALAGSLFSAMWAIKTEQIRTQFKINRLHCETHGSLARI